MISRVHTLSWPRRHINLRSDNPTSFCCCETIALAFTCSLPITSRPSKSIPVIISVPPSPAVGEFAKAPPKASRSPRAVVNALVNHAYFERSGYGFFMDDLNASMYVGIIVGKVHSKYCGTSIYVLPFKHNINLCPRMPTTVIQRLSYRSNTCISVIVYISVSLVKQHHVL